MPIHNSLFSQEKTFTATMAGPVAEMWQQRQEGYFTGVNNCRIGWMSLTPGHSDKVIVVVNGRVESYWKYQELFYDLLNQGYHIYSFDHRGQGVSERLVENSDLGHIEDFNDYVDDLYSFISKIVKPHGYRHQCILAHSMGGAITSLLLSRYPTLIDRAVLCAPMHGIYINPLLKPFAEKLTKLCDKYQSTPNYAIGQRPYHVRPFTNNVLCQSEIRYKWFLELYQKQPQLQVGGASNRWVWQSIEAARQTIIEAEKIITPIVLLQGSDDKVVDNKAHHAFSQAVNQGSGHCELKTITGARHEILFESDQYRNLAIDVIYDHFAVRNI